MSCRVWSKFQATRSDGSLLKFRIEDVPKSRIDDAAALFIKHIINDGLFGKAAGVPRNPNAIKESQEFINELVKDPAVHIMICCDDNDEDEVGQIVGVSLMSLVTTECKSPENKELQTDEMRKLFELIDAVSNKYQPMEQLKLSRYYTDIGVIVHPEFRKLGIATEFFKARRLACVAYDVPATGALMTSVGSQKAAQKDNWETVLEINLDDFGRQHGVTFDESGIRKVMIWKKPQFN